MTRRDYAADLSALARSRQRIVTVRELTSIGVPLTVVRNLCAPGGRWQRVLPKVVLLDRGPLTAGQRLRAALAYASASASACGPGAPARLTGGAALALYGLRTAPGPPGSGAVDVLVPTGRPVRTHTWVRVHHTPEAPGPGPDLTCGAGSRPGAGSRSGPASRSGPGFRPGSGPVIDGLPVAPLFRAVADGVRASCDPDWIAAVLGELVRDLGTHPAQVAAMLGPELRAGKPAAAEALRALLPHARHPVSDVLRSLVRRAGVSPPLWHPVLRSGGVRVASPDAYWPHEGVALAVLDAVSPAVASSSGSKKPVPGLRGTAGPARLEALGVRVLCVHAEVLRRHPGRAAVALRAALTAGARGPLPRIETGTEPGPVPVC